MVLFRKKTLEKDNLPKHVVIIPDGNRRYAIKKMIGYDRAYKYAFKKMIMILKVFEKLNIKNISFWGMSMENLFRDKDELDVFFNVVEKGLIEHILENKYIYKNEIAVKFIGDKSYLNSTLKKLIMQIEENTVNHIKTNLNIFVAYSGRKEIIDACQSIIDIGIKKIDNNIFENHLYTKGIPDPDLIIRTSGEHRLSGFMPWQSVYSEIYFEKTYFPLIREKHLYNALRSYQERERRYGK